MNVFAAVLGLVALQRAGELALAAANTRRLRTRGAYEVDASGYKWFVMLHVGWLVALAATVQPQTPASWPLLAFYAALQPVRLWAIASLGRRWTTRLIVVPGDVPVSRGAYRYFRHPNYAAVAGEVALLPLAFGATGVAVVFTAANLALIVRRVRLEEAALKTAAHLSAR